MLMRTSPLPTLDIQARLEKFKKQLRFVVEIITPERAKELLENHNTVNRYLSKEVAARYANMMKLDDWNCDGQTIVFDTFGDLVNGQHRLKACVLSGMPFVTCVVYGAEPNARYTTDDLKPRSGTDMFVMDSTSHARIVSAAAQVAIRYRDGMSRSQPKIANARQKEFYHTHHPDFAAWVHHVPSGKSKYARHIPKVVAVTYLASRKYPVEALEFLTGFVTGVGLPARSPILALRNKYDIDKRLRGWELVSLVVTCWNAYIDGRVLVHPKVLHDKRFPEINGALKPGTGNGGLA